jgi:hypothetical protein
MASKQPQPIAELSVRMMPTETPGEVTNLCSVPADPLAFVTLLHAACQAFIQHYTAAQQALAAATEQERQAATDKEIDARSRLLNNLRRGGGRELGNGG